MAPGCLLARLVSLVMLPVASGVCPWPSSRVCPNNTLDGCGTWEDWSSCRGIIKIENHKLVGTIPPALGSATQINGFEMAHNAFTGTIPKSFGSLMDVQMIDLSHNMLSGTLPRSFGSLVRLEELKCTANSNLTSLNNTFTRTCNHHQRDLNHNNDLAGPVPLAMCTRPRPCRPEGCNGYCCDLDKTGLYLGPGCPHSWCGLVRKISGSWNFTPRACPRECGADATILHRNVTCSTGHDGDCDPSTKPEPFIKICPKTPDCAQDNNDWPVHHPLLIATGAALVVIVVIIGVVIGRARRKCGNNAAASNGDKRPLLTRNGNISFLQLGSVLGLRKGLGAIVQGLKARDLLLKKEDVRLGSLLGSGAAGTIYNGFLAGDKANVALKETFQTLICQDTSDILHEVELLIKLKHRNIVQLYGLWTRVDDALDSTRLYMVMELCKGGNLHTRIAKGGITLNEKIRWARNMADGICYLHTREPPVLHRDIKPANVVLTQGGQAKLVDFGLSKYAKATAGPLTQNIGTVAYMAPELMSDDDCARAGGDARAVDVFSFAVLLCGLWTVMEPYKGLLTKQILVNVHLHGHRPSLSLPASEDDKATNDLHPTMCELINEMWVTESGERPTARVVAKRLHEMPGPDDDE